MNARDRLTLIKDSLCMIVAIAGAIYEGFIRTGDPRLEMLGFYALLLGFGTAVPAAASLFNSGNQSPTPPDPSTVSNGSRVSLERKPGARRRGDGGTTRRR